VLAALEQIARHEHQVVIGGVMGTYGHMHSCTKGKDNAAYAAVLRQTGLACPISLKRQLIFM
jgi:hypothetical protein